MVRRRDRRSARSRRARAEKRRVTETIGSSPISVGVNHLLFRQPVISRHQHMRHGLAKRLGNGRRNATPEYREHRDQQTRRPRSRSHRPTARSPSGIRVSGSTARKRLTIGAIKVCAIVGGEKILSKGADARRVGPVLQPRQRGEDRSRLRIQSKGIRSRHQPAPVADEEGRVPSRVSSAPIARETAGWDTPKRCAAAVVFRVVITACSTSSSRTPRA